MIREGIRGEKDTKMLVLTAPVEYAVLATQDSACRGLGPRYTLFYCPCGSCPGIEAAAKAGEKGILLLIAPEVGRGEAGLVLSM